jgi:hypothetical protein
MLRYGVDPKLLSLRSGVDYNAEQAAEELLRQHRDTAPTDYIYLSDDQLDLRARREIGNQLGVADASLVAGMYRREHNPLSGTRPGKLGRSHDDG